MLFERYNLGLDESSYKKYKGIQVIKNKYFQDYVDSLKKNENRYVTLVHNTRLKEVKPEDIEKRLEKGDDILHIDDSYYELRKSRDWLCSGYIAVEDDKFVRVESNIILLIMWLLFGLLLGFGILFNLKSCSGDEFAWLPDLDVALSNYDGPQDEASVDAESIVIPGFYKFTVTSGGNNLQLYNPVGNTVYFQYDIYKVESVSIAANYPDIESAQERVTELSKQYTCESNDGSCVFKDADGNSYSTVKLYRAIGNGSSYDVLEEEVSVLYQTKLIGPGQQVLWDAYHSLGNGTCDIKLKVSTYDIETGAECYGAIQTVTAEVK